MNIGKPKYEVSEGEDAVITVERSGDISKQSTVSLLTKTDSANNEDFANRTNTEESVILLKPSECMLKVIYDCVFTCLCTVQMKLRHPSPFPFIKMRMQRA